MLAVPILDTTLVTVVRLLEGRPVTQGGRDHTSHRLVYEGLSDKRAVVLLSGVSAALGLTSLAYKVLDDTRITLLGVLITFAFLLQFGSYLADVNRAPVSDRAPSFVASLLVHRRRLVEVVVDFLLITASFTAAFIIRLEGTGVMWQRHVFDRSLPALLVARYVFFIAFGLYRGVWRYAGARDAVSVLAACVLSEAAAFLFTWATVPFNGFPRSVYLIDALLCTFLIGVSRFWERAVATRPRVARRPRRPAPRAHRRRRPERPEPAARAARDARRARRRLRGRRRRRCAAAASRASRSSAASTTSDGRSAGSRRTPSS